MTVTEALVLFRTGNLRKGYKGGENDENENENVCNVEFLKKINEQKNWNE